MLAESPEVSKAAPGRRQWRTSTSTNHLCEK
jgi:hypothetical protein